MAEKDPRRVTFIWVKPLADKGNNSSPEKGENENGVTKQMKEDHNNSGILTSAKHTKSSPEDKEETMPGSEDGLIKYPKVTEKYNEYNEKETKKMIIKKNALLPLDTMKIEGKFEQPKKELNSGEPKNRSDSTKKKKKKTEKKENAQKNKKTKEKEPVPEVQSAKVKSGPKQEVEAIKATTNKDEAADDNKKSRKLPCCFGFISTWIAKKKQKRRDKKKKAIASRSALPSLVQYEHKKSKGGEAFVIEVDCRPSIKKPLLPPIKQTAGPIRRGSYYQFQRAEARRAEELAKRTAAAVTYEKKQRECKERKLEIDYQVRKKADLSIRCKQAGAERNRNNRSRRTPTRAASIQSSQCGSISNAGDPFAFGDGDSDSDTLVNKSDGSDIDPDAWKVDDVDIFSF